jgi:hypothetical protein
LNPNFNLQIISYLFCFALLLQFVEMIVISKDKTFLKVWSFANLKSSLPCKKLFQNIYSEKGFRLLLLFEFILIIGLAIRPTDRILVLGIAIIHLLICLRFRGLFNGGSDMMVFVIATGLIIGGKFGLIYIAIHTCYSYFKAGIVKIVQPTWRSGLAISQFLGVSLYPNFQRLEPPLRSKKLILLFLSYSVLSFELLLPLVFIFPNVVFVYCVIAILFHAVNSIVFGLNRFFWIWLAAWPAVIYFVQTIKS